MIDRFARALRGFIPDPFVIALALTALVFVAGAVQVLVSGTGSLGGLVDGWANGAPLPGKPPDKLTGGLWSLLAFSMQMCLILVTGYVVANTGPVRRLIRILAGVPRTTGQAAAMVSLVAMGIALLNWGFGLIAGALLARDVGREMQRRGLPVHHPLLAAAGYTGLAVWHGGLSGSAPLKVTTTKGLTEILGAPLAEAVGEISLWSTVLSPRNLVATGVVLVLVPLTLYAMAPRDPATVTPPPAAAGEGSSAVVSWLRSTSPGIAGWLEGGPWLSLVACALIVAWAVPWAAGGGLSGLNPNHVNTLFLLVGLALAWSPLRYMELAEQAARACGGIIVQYPLYGGILGVMVASGLITTLSGWLPGSASALSLTTFLSAGLVNLLVPSGGGQWSVQGPLVMEAATSHGIEPGRIVLALAWGDQWTNLIQPFWALPLLGITGARAGDILGYTLVVAVVVGAVFAVAAFV